MSTSKVLLVECRVLNEGAFSAIYLKYHDTKRFN